MISESERPFVSLREASFRLGDRIVFDRTSWTWHCQQQWAIIGANGSGKSLLGDALRGRLPLVYGQLRYHFKPASGLTPEESIGHVSFEDRKSELHQTVVQSRWNSIEEESALRVRDFLSYDRVMDVNPFEVTRRHDQARPQFARRQRQAIALLDLAPLLDHRLISLSNGERQRVQLARALSHPMRLLVLDEPFVGLDTTRREHFRALLERLMDTPLRVLLLTTRIEDLPRAVTHLVCVDRCQLVAAGQRSEILGSQSELQGPRIRIGSAGSSIIRPAASRRLARSADAARKPLLQLRGVTVRYGDSTILPDINWSVRPGESWALLGPNGAGKTTLLSLIQGDHPQAYMNDVTVFGRPRGSGDSIWEVKGRIGWVSPELHLHFNNSATCLDVVVSGFHDTIGLFQLPTRRQRTAARYWLTRFQLSEFAQSPLFALSTGLQRMALLARALVKNPPLLILDEPCQGLDPEHRSTFIAAVDALIRAGATTAIYVTHREDEIPPSIKRVLRLSAGRSRLQARSLSGGLGSRR
jgi:molybdate transport system ATP-binding protein